MRTAPAFARVACAALLALLLGLRLLGATGYMPGFHRGAVTIIVCPDADPDAPLAVDAHHHQGDSKHKHGSTCSYASASSLGALGAEFGALLAVLIFAAAALLLGRTFLFLERNRLRERPPTRGPPLSA